MTMVLIIYKQEMGKHKAWRKIAKKERRRKLRIVQATQREEIHNVSPTSYESWLREQEALELFEYEQIEKTNMIEHEKWMKAEKIAVEQWQRLQDRREQMHQERLVQEAKRKQEWELEKERRKQEQERLKQIEEENIRKQKLFMEHLEQFLSGDSAMPPPELLISRETKPNCEPCPFFAKTASCRFGDQCSRNHKHPGISKVILATNFYSHFGLENANVSEYDTDVMLEYEDSDTYKAFKEFFDDVLPEFEKFGKIMQFKVCKNYEKHLRGNTYVEFAELRCAVAAYRTLHSRWYGGKQISLQFCHITSWKRAVCGLQSRGRCPKGRSCNFLHVFRNPNNLFGTYTDPTKEYTRPQRTPRSWRWSESPEAESPKRKRSRSRSRDRRRRREERHRRRDKDERRNSHSRRSSRRRRSDSSSS